MGAAELSFVVKAIDQASGTLDHVGGKVGGMRGALGKLGGMAGGALVGGIGIAVAGIGGLGAILASSTKEAMAAEEVSAQLEAVLKSTGGVAGMTAEAINAHALALSKATRFEDDAIVGAQSLLLTFTNIGKDVFPQATESILDLSTAFGMDLQSASIMVGKALNDPIAGLTALGRAGVQFTAAQKETIKGMIEMGDVAGAQKLILKELETQIGGSAEAAGQTFAGQMDIMKNQIGNIKEQIGGALLPILTDLAAKIGPQLVEGAQKFADWLVAVGIPALLQFGQFISTQVVPALQAFGQWFQANVLPILQAFGNYLVTTVIPALQTFGQWFEANIIPALRQFGTFIATKVVPALQTMGQWFEQHILPVLKSFSDFITKGVIPVVQSLLKVFNEEANPVFEKLNEWLGPILGGTLRTLKELFGGVMGIVEDLLGLIGELLSKAGEALGKLAGLIGGDKGKSGGGAGGARGFEFDSGARALAPAYAGGRALAGAGGAAGAGAWNVTLNINAPGGNPRAVAAAAQQGVLAAARSMGLR